MANPNSAINGAQVQNQGNLAVMPSMTLGPIDVANLANPHLGELDDLAEALAQQSPEVRRGALQLLSPKRRQFMEKLIEAIQPCHCEGAGCSDCVPEMSEVSNWEQFGGGIGGR